MNLYSPAEMANNYISTGKGKVNMSLAKMLVLAIMAGVFIALGGMACTTVSATISNPSVAKLVGAMIFPGGLAMVLLAGAELFTGNCLLTIPLLSREIKFAQMLKNWVVVFVGNWIGGIIVAALAAYSHTGDLFSKGLAVSMISTAAAKCTLSFGDALLRGILCNFLVCIAVWCSFAAKDVASKILAIFFPVTMFVACGFEHCVANMYFITVGFFNSSIPEYAQAATEAGVDLSSLTVGNYVVGNILPVTIGNIIGGAICVGCVYWFVYLKKNSKTES